MNTILLGNGLTRISYNNSWDALVHVVGEDKVIINNKNYLPEAQIPNTIQFNAKAISEFLEGQNDIQDLQSKYKQLKENIKEQMQHYEPHNLHDRLVNLHPQHFVTTNYDDVIDKAILRNGNFRHMKISDSYLEQKYSIRRNRQYWNENNKIVTWNIHGEIEYINSIMLGYDHYLGTIRLIDDYLNGTYFYNRRLRIVSPMKEKLQNGSPKILSWIDLFFFSDIHILGFGYGYEELDLWYLLIKRREMQIELGDGKINNRIYYYGNNIEKGKRELFKLYGVDIVSSGEVPIGNDYTPIYADLIEKMRSNFGI